MNRDNITDLKLSPQGLDAVAAIRPFGDEPELMALYDCADLSRPVAVYDYHGPKGRRGIGPGLEHAWRDNLLAICVQRDGSISGHESGPQDGLGHGELGQRLLAISDEQPTPDTLAILIRIAEYWDARAVGDICATSQDEGDDWPEDFDDWEVVTELCRRHAALPEAVR